MEYCNMQDIKLLLFDSVAVYISKINLAMETANFFPHCAI